mmetsp:Transcript_2753/g.8275  ORF Transcript_2753/g.8275 Transcript_2753/m.8275 type:complete len:219 (+) Transcript_2753:1249-1905(+)
MAPRAAGWPSTARWERAALPCAITLKRLGTHSPLTPARTAWSSGSWMSSQASLASCRRALITTAKAAKTVRWVHRSERTAALLRWRQRAARMWARASKGAAWPRRARSASRAASAWVSASPPKARAKSPTSLRCTPSRRCAARSGAACAACCYAAATAVACCRWKQTSWAPTNQCTRRWPRAPLRSLSYCVPRPSSARPQCPGSGRCGCSCATARCVI